jgi:hypothetical protein
MVEKPEKVENIHAYSSDDPPKKDHVSSWIAFLIVALTGVAVIAATTPFPR